MIKKTGFISGSVLVSALVLSSCQTTEKRTVSLAEAKQITATFQTVKVPPPKTIDDIKTLLDSTRISNAAAHAEKKNLVESAVPTDLNGENLIDYYWRRASAASDLGLIEMETRNLKLAIQTAKKAGSGNRKLSRLYSNLTWSLFESGQTNAAIESTKKSIQYHPKHPKRVLNLGSLALKIGDVDLVRKNRSDVIRIAGKFRGPVAWVHFSRSQAEANLAQAEGRWIDAVHHRRRSIALFKEANFKGAKVRSHLSIQRNLIQSLRKAGLILEAEITGRDALKLALSEFGKDSGETAKQLVPLAKVLMEQNRFFEANILLYEAEKIFTVLGTDNRSVFKNAVLHWQGMSLAANEQWAHAMKRFDVIAVNMGTQNTFYQQRFGYRLPRALTLLKSGRLDEAQELLDTLEKRTIKSLGLKHQKTARVMGLLALLALERNDLETAFNQFNKAIPILLSRSREADDDNIGLSEKFVRFILEGYIDLLSREDGARIASNAGLNPAAESFVIANRARARVVQKSLGASAARASVNNPELADFARREQDAKHQISNLYGLLASLVNASSIDHNPATIQSIRGKIDDLRTARAALMEAIENRFPDYAQIINPKPATVTTVAQNLRSGETLISFLVAEKATYSWAISKSGAVQFGTSLVSKKGIGDMVADLRTSLDPKAATLGDIPQFDLQLASKVYDILLKPVEAGWKEATSLLVVQEGSLGQLPLAVLPSKSVALIPDQSILFDNYRAVPWLIRDHAIAYLPSPSALLTLRGRQMARSSNPKSFAGFADPYFNKQQAVTAKAKTSKAVVANVGGLLQSRGLPFTRRAAPTSEGVSNYTLRDLPRLPDTALEISAMAAALDANPSTDVFIGSNATEKQIKGMDLSNRKVIAFATHGLVAGELNGLVEPALALSDPNLTGASGEDGLLTMSEIMGLHLNADWIVLSACNTASGNGQGAESVSGLGSAFFYAGARALLATSWPVETTSARELTGQLFALQAKHENLDRSEALRQAKIELIERKVYENNGKSVFSYAHPIFWAPFILVGEGHNGSAYNS